MKNDSAARLAALCQKYALPAPAAVPRTRACFSVPVIGPFGAGKSALLDALLGAPLLPTGLLPTTPVPTAITFGAEPCVRVFRGQTVSIADLGSLRDGRLTESGITRLELCVPPVPDAPAHLTLVELPGLEAGADTAPLRAALSAGLACLLVFSAEDPVLKRDTALLLREAQLQALPLCVFMSKCDKLPPRLRREAAAALQDSLARQLGGSWEIGCVSAGSNADIAPLRAALLRLDALAAKRGRREEALAGLRCARPLLAYLRQRLPQAELKENEPAALLARLSFEHRALSDAFQENDRRFASLRAQAIERAAASAAAPLQAACAGAAELRAGGRDPSSYLQSVQQALLRGAVDSELNPLLCAYAQSSARLLRLHGLTPPAAAPADCTAAVFACFARQAQGEPAEPNQLGALLARCLTDGSQETAAGLSDALQAPVLAELAARQAALADARAQASAQDGSLQADRTVLAEDLAAAAALVQEYTAEEGANGND